MLQAWGTSLWFCSTDGLRAIPEPVDRHHRGGDPQVRLHNRGSLSYESVGTADRPTPPEDAIAGAPDTVRTQGESAGCAATQ